MPELTRHWTLRWKCSPITTTALVAMEHFEIAKSCVEYTVLSPLSAISSFLVFEDLKILQLQSLFSSITVLIPDHNMITSRRINKVSAQKVANHKTRLSSFTVQCNPIVLAHDFQQSNWLERAGSLYLF